MKQIIVRLLIVTFGLFCVGVITWGIYVGDPNHYEKLDSISTRLDSDPSPKHLRKLLNYPADGAYSYYKMALTGSALCKHPELFESVSTNLHTDLERGTIKRLATQGVMVFEHYPELKPPNFEQQFQTAAWLDHYKKDKTATHNNQD